MLYKNVRKCPMCFQEQLKVSDSRDYKGTIRRKRVCLLCGYTFRTLEIATDDIDNLKNNDVVYRKLLELEKQKAEILAEIGQEE